MRHKFSYFFVNWLLFLLFLPYNIDMNKRIEYLKEKVHALPSNPGVYKMMDEYGNIIYVGKAKNLKNRVSSYFVNTFKPEKVAQMVANVYDFDYIICTSELEALNVESNLIHNLQPFYNILLKDGKAFPYMKIDIKSEFPKVEITRKVKKDGSLYFGPFVGGVSGTEMYKIINNTFKLKDCNITKLQKRACLNYHIGNCLAPCIGRVTREEYMAEVKRVIEFLKGDLRYAKNVLTEKMKACAENENFEKAIEYKHSLKSIEVLQSKIVTELTSLIDIDVFSYVTNGQTSIVTLLTVRGGKMLGVNNYNVLDASSSENEILSNFVTQYYMQTPAIPENIILPFESETLHEWLRNERGGKVNLIYPKRGINKRLLGLAEINGKQDLEKSLAKEEVFKQKTIGAMKELQKLLGLSCLPKRIEGFDISHMGGTNTVASMVVFENGLPNKKHYRKFKISLENAGAPNDFESMKEVVTRRFLELNGKDTSFTKMPDLVLIDGGKGQLGYAVEVLKNLGIDVDIISLAEKNEEVYLPHKSEPVIISRDNYALKLLQNVRDESHRFAITFQRTKRKNTTLSSELNKIDGVGEKTINVLFRRFKSLANIKTASLSELEDTKGVTKAQAKNIFEYFNN